MDLDRRCVLKWVTGLLSSAALGGGPTLAESAGSETLSRLLGLGRGQVGWLADLTLEEQSELRQALREGGQRPVARRTVQLLTRVLGQRSRLYAFLDYPQVADQRSLCDGLMRE